MAEEKKSRLYAFKPLIERWPAISKPEGHVNFRTKILWTLTCLLLYFLLTNIMIFGLQSNYLDMFENYRFIMAGASGSIMHLGIGPIVTASIILQLFVGANIINIDLQDPDDKAIYQGFQKILVFIMIIVEAVPQVFGYLSPSSGLESLLGGNAALANLIIVIQLCMGGFLIFFMDEVISKWGIGSGVSLFIAAGVTQQIFTGLFSWLPVQGGGMEALSLNNPPGGVIPGTYYLASEMSLSEITQQGYRTIFMGNPQIGYVNAIVPLLSFLVIFLFVAYVQSTRIELPLAHGRVRGARGRYPIKLIYASVIPVILVSALLANINMFAMLLYRAGDSIPLLGGQWWIGKYDLTTSTSPLMGGAWYLNKPNGVNSWLLPMLAGGSGGHEPWQFALRIIIYLFFLIIGSILFAKFWIDTTNMGPDAVARQIQSSGMQIPGFRRDPRILKRVLKRYIPIVTVLSGAIVGALAGVSDVIGTVGKTSGTGVLLAVSIITNLYEEIGKEQAMEMHPVLRGFFGKE
ncbi:MAG: preprotein translocase subunit SecY [Candidatus Thermoplasmatota archaeon]